MFNLVNCCFIFWLDYVAFYTSPFVLQWVLVVDKSHPPQHLEIKWNYLGARYKFQLVLVIFNSFLICLIHYVLFFKLQWAYYAIGQDCSFNHFYHIVLKIILKNFPLSVSNDSWQQNSYLLEASFSSFSFLQLFPWEFPLHLHLLLPYTYSCLCFIGLKYPQSTLVSWKFE